MASAGQKEMGTFADIKSVNVLTAQGSNAASNIPQTAILLIGRWRRTDYRKCLDSHEHLPLPAVKREYWMS